MSNQPQNSDDMRREVLTWLEAELAVRPCVTVGAGGYCRRVAEREGYPIQPKPGKRGYVKIWRKGTDLSATFSMGYE